MQKNVNIRSRKNSDVKKTITARAWEYYPKDKWELDNSVVEAIQEKKNPVEDVADDKATVSPAKNVDLGKSVPVDDFLPPVLDQVAGDDLGDSNEFVNPTSDKTELDSLREQYETKFGKPADKRMKEETLKQKLNENS